MWQNSKTCRWLSFLSIIVFLLSPSLSHNTCINKAQTKPVLIFAAFIHPPPLSISFFFVHYERCHFCVCVCFVYIYCVKMTRMQMCTGRNKFKLKCVSLSRCLVCFQSASKQGLIGPGCSSSLEMTQRSEVGFSVSEVGMTNPHRRKSTEEYTLNERRRQRNTIKNDEWAPRAAEADDSSSGTKCCVLCKTLP